MMEVSSSAAAQRHSLTGDITLIDYSEDMIQTRYKKDLAGQLGNLLNRATAASLLPNGHVPAKNQAIDARDQMLHHQISQTAGGEGDEHLIMY